MPSTSERMARTMAAARHNPEIRRHLGIPLDVATEFNEADKGTLLLHRAMQHRGDARRGAEKIRKAKKGAVKGRFR